MLQRCFKGSDEYSQRQNVSISSCFMTGPLLYFNNVTSLLNKIIQIKEPCKCLLVFVNVLIVSLHQNIAAINIFV